MDNSKGEKNMEDQAWRIIPEYLVRIFQYAFLHVDRISKLGFRSQRQDWLATWFFFVLPSNSNVKQNAAHGQEWQLWHGYVSPTQ